MKFFNVILALLVICYACNTTNTTQTDSPSTSTSTSTETDKDMPDRAGAVFGFTTSLSMTSLLSELEEADTLQALSVKGEVREVCQAKGCWMTIGDEEMMVKFKDYGFFVPKDISGRQVVMHGKAYYQVTPLEELRHYAEDAGKSAEEIAAITEPKKELRFLASGVLLLPNEGGAQQN
ncbi:MAG: DUF4920 domain-containing protein [Bacteroidota bacterium]